MISGIADLRLPGSYADAQKNFSREALWALFDGDRGRLNMAHECVDRHRNRGPAVSVAHADGHDEIISYCELADWSGRIANYLTSEGVKRGDRIAIMLEPGLAFYASLFGVMKCGAVAVPLFTLFGPQGLALRIDDCEPVMLVSAEHKLDMAIASGVAKTLTGTALLEAAAGHDTRFQWTTSADDMALYQYTSGTTRELPEAVKHRHRAVVTVAVAALYATGVRPDDRFMCPSSPAWGHGLAHGTLGPLGMGAHISAYAGQFSAERLLEAIRTHQITNLSAAATHYRMMRAASAVDLQSTKLEKASFTGEALDGATAAWAHKVFGVPICSIYGTTEVGVILGQYPGVAGLPVKQGSLGRPMPGLQVAVHHANRAPVLPHPAGPDSIGSSEIGPDEVDQTQVGPRKVGPGEVGELVLKRRDGSWLPTKDLGHVDIDGDFFHDGRADDVIISAGWTISAREIEEALLAHGEVAEAAVIGVPDNLRGQVIKAFVVSRREDGASDAQEPRTHALQAEALAQFVKSHLSAHAYPRQIEFVAELPRTPAGKINRRVLREREAALTPSGSET